MAGEMVAIPNQLLPLLATYDYEALRDDIERRGVIVPVIVNKATGEIIDGHHRVQIAEELGIEYPVEAVDIEDVAEARIIAVGLNVKRRRLSLEQRQELAKALRQDGWTQQEIADAIGVVQQTVANWLKEEIEGDVTNTKNGNGYTMRANAKLSAEQKNEIYERAQAGESQTALAADYSVTRPAIHKAIKAVARKLEREANIKSQTLHDVVDNPPTIELADAVEWLERQPQCDLLLTDPPYSTDVDDISAFAESWLPLALSKLKSTGRAFVFVGAYPEELAAYMNIAMPTQVLVWTYKNTLGPSPKLDYKLNWQAILYYRMPDAEPLDCPVMLEQFSVQEINAPDGRLGDRYHAWQKPMEIGERFVRHATREGDLVLDPFCCTGTFLLAAAKYGREARGCDLSMEHLNVAESRGCRIVGGAA